MHSVPIPVNVEGDFRVLYVEGIPIAHNGDDAATLADPDGVAIAHHIDGRRLIVEGVLLVGACDVVW